MATIDISGLDKAEVLAALYNNSKMQGMGVLHYTPEPMTVQEATELLNHADCFDYLKGRVMKVGLTSDTLDTWGYDRDNGEGAAFQAISHLFAKQESA
jgi:hypothetical protein